MIGLTKAYKVTFEFTMLDEYLPCMSTNDVYYSVEMRKCIAFCDISLCYRKVIYHVIRCRLACCCFFFVRVKLVKLASYNGFTLNCCLSLHFSGCILDSCSHLERMNLQLFD